MAIGELKKFVETDPVAEKNLRRFAASAATDQYARLGWAIRPGEPDEDTKLRATILGLTLYGEDPEAISKARHMYDTTPLTDLDPELRPLILSSVARYDDGAVFDTLFATYRTTTSGELQQDICLGITSTRVPEKINLLLESIKDSSIIRPQDVRRWFAYLIRGRESRTAAWEWIRDNWQWVVDTFKGDFSYDDFPRYCANALSTERQLNEYVEFFEPKKEVPALTRVITIGIGEIKGRVELIERDRESVIAALADL